MLANLFRNTKAFPNGFTLSDFLLPHGDARQGGRTRATAQPLKHQERMIDMWIAGSNANLKRRRGGP